MRMNPLAGLGLLFIGLGATAQASAADWRLCMANAGDAAGHKIMWSVTQPFEVSGIPDWQQQFEAIKAERRAHAASFGMTVQDAGFACTESMPDRASVAQRRHDMELNYDARRQFFEIQNTTAIVWMD